MGSAPADGEYAYVSQDLSQARKQPSGATGAAGAVDRERRIRLEATKRRRAHVLRAKLNEESKEKRYRHALSKRQHVQQEYARSVRKQFRSWRKQASPAPHTAAIDGTASHQNLSAGRANYPRSITPAATVPSTSRPGGLDGARNRCSSTPVRPSIAAGAVCTWIAGAGATGKRASSSSSSSGGSNASRWDKGATGRDSAPSNPEMAASRVVGNNLAIEGGGAPDPGKTAREKIRCERWANLPPELRAIKDRWLGESSEEIAPLSDANGVISIYAGASIPSRVDRPDQGKWSEADPRGEIGRLEGTWAPVGEPTVGDAEGRGRGANGLPQGETTDEIEDRRRGHQSSIGDNRGASANHSQRSPERQGTIRDTPHTEDRDMRQMELPPQTDGQRDGHQHPSPVAASTAAHQDLRCSRPGRDASTPQPDEGRQSRGFPRREGGAGGKNTADGKQTTAPGILEGLGASPAPAFGGALGAPEDMHSREKVRNQLRALRSRLPRSSNGDIPPAVSPTLLQGDRKTRPSSQELNPTAARTQPLSNARPQAEVGDAGGVDQHRDRYQGNSDDRAGAASGGRTRPREARQEEEVHLGIVQEDSDHAAGGKQQLDGALLETDEKAGVEQKIQAVGTVRDDVAAAAVEGVPAGCAGVKSTSESTSTASRPSELFDSLDLSASPPRHGGVLSTGVPAAAQHAPTTVAVAHQRPQSQSAKDLDGDKASNRTVVAAAAPTSERPPPSPPQDGPPPDKAASVQAIASVPRNQPNQASSQGTPTKLWLPEKAPESPSTAPRNAAKAEPSGKGDNKNRTAACCVSRLRAPGWGREAKVTAIPPASATAGGGSTGPRYGAAAPSADAALLPWDLLTPVTEAVTVDEHSAVSRSTRGTARMTPASSDVSGSRPDQTESLGVVRGRCHHQSPQSLRSKPRRHAPALPAARGLDPPVESSGAGIDRNNHGREKRAMWGSGVVASGARSAPGKSTARPAGTNTTPSGSALSSQPGYRSSPLSGAGDHVGARGSTFSSASEEMRPGRQAGGGYVAAMGRRARSRARCEAARRLAAAALAAKRARPSTPISERARWGKGRESQVEAERRKLLLRRAEYAEELKRKAKEDAEALARRKLVDTTPVMLPADPRHVRALTLEHNSPSRDVDSPFGAREGNTSRAAGVRTNHDRQGQVEGAHVVHCGSALSPADSQESHARGGQTVRSVGHTTGGGGGGGSGGSGGTRRFQKSERKSTHNRQSTAEEEERLMASIARLDTLLGEENGDTGATASRKVSGFPRGGVRAPSDPPKSGRDVERKPVRAPAGGIAKTRVRKGGGRETKTCGSLGMAPTMAPKCGSNHGVSEPAVSGAANEHAASAVPSCPGMFPPLFSRVPPCPSERKERGRYAPPDADEMHSTGSPLTETATPRVPASHVPGTRRDTDREQRWTARRDGGSREATPSQYHRPHDHSQQAVLTRHVADSSSRGGHIAHDNGARRQDEYVQRAPRSPGRYRDERHGHNSGGWHGYYGDTREYYGDRDAAADPRAVWDVRAERGGWTGEPHPDGPTAYGRCRGVGDREWDRREDGGQYRPTHAARW